MSASTTPEFDREFSADELREGFYRDMVLVRRIDTESTALQRHGELGIWAPLLGQEAAQVGVGRALRPLPRAFALLRDATVVLLEIAPKGLDLDDVRRHLLDRPRRHRRARPARVDHHQRHPVAVGARDGHRRLPRRTRSGATLDELCACVAEHFDIHHATFQVSR